MTLTRDEIISSIERRNKDVAHYEVPEWGGEVCIRRLSSADMERTRLGATEKDPQIMPRVIAASLTDENGVPLFTDDDIAVLATSDIEVAARVFKEVVKVNGLSSKSVDEAVQAFENAQPDTSSSS